MTSAPTSSNWGSFTTRYKAKRDLKMQKLQENPSLSQFGRQVCFTPLDAGWTLTTRSEPVGQRHIDAHRLYKLAGLFEGEGLIGFYTGRLVVRVANSEPALCYQFANRWGGKVREEKPRPNQKDNWLRTWVWGIYGQTANDMLVELEPYMDLGKKDQALLAIKMFDMGPSPMRDWMEQELKDLKRVDQGNWEVTESA